MAVVPGSALTSGTLTARGRFTQAGGQTNLHAALAWTNLSGSYAAYRFQDYHGHVQLEGALRGRQFELQNLTAAVQRGAEAGGTIHGMGSVDLSRPAGTVSLGLTNLNHHAVAPFVNPLLAPNELQAMALNAHGTATFDPEGDSAVRTTVQLTNLWVGTARQRLTPAPLAAEAQLDLAWRAARFKVNQAALRLVMGKRYQMYCHFSIGYWERISS